MVTMTYTADITLEGKNWPATITNSIGVSTWAPNFSTLGFYVHEAIALAEDLPYGAEYTLEVTWRMTDTSLEIAVG